MSKKPIGQIIKERRTELGLTQEQLAERLGYKSRSTINKIELGINDIAQRNLDKFAEALQTTKGYLMGMTDDPSPLENNDLQSFLDQLDDNIGMAAKLSGYMDDLESIRTPGRSLAESLRAHGVAENDVQAVLLFLTLTDAQKALMYGFFKEFAKEDNS